MVPNDFHVIEATFNAKPYALGTLEGQAAFVDDAVAALHAYNGSWGHLKKSPSQTNIHGHGEDSALYLDPLTGLGWAVDFIASAGASNAHIYWNPDVASYYTISNWINPKTAHQSTPQPPALKSREVFYSELKEINAFYAAPEGLQRPGGMILVDAHGNFYADVEALGAWGYDLMLGTTVNEAKDRIKQSEEWQIKHPLE